MQYNYIEIMLMFMPQLTINKKATIQNKITRWNKKIQINRIPKYTTQAEINKILRILDCSEKRKASFHKFCTIPKSGRPPVTCSVPFRKAEGLRSHVLYLSENRKASGHTFCTFPKTGRPPVIRSIPFRKPESIRSRVLHSSENRKALYW
jgi:hypothetical protein